jgi:hypothetical protein
VEKRITRSPRRTAPKASRARKTTPAQSPTQEIAARAYQRFVERGGAHGHDVEDWLAAEAELRRAR